MSSVKRKLTDSSRVVDEPVKEEPRLGEPVQVKANKKQIAEKENNPANIKISPFVKKNKTSKRLEDEKQGKLFIASEGPLPSISLLDPAVINKDLGFSKEKSSRC